MESTEGGRGWFILNEGKRLRSSRRGSVHGFHSESHGIAARLMSEGALPVQKG